MDKFVKATDVKDLLNGLDSLPWEDEVEDLVNKLATADVAEVKHGEWKDDCVAFYEGATNGYTCSSCGNFVSEETFDLIDFDSDFCGNCGAKMDWKGGT